MYSYRQYTPGGVSKIKNKYVLDTVYCDCLTNKSVKYTGNSFNTNSNMSSNMRIAQIIKSTVGGKVVFGNSYLGELPKVNYLGRTEGQLGGSGSSPKNQF
jgi:hypothetical protein